MIGTSGFFKWKLFHLRLDDLVRELRLGTTALLGLGVLVLSVPPARAQIVLEGVLTCPVIANTEWSATLHWTVDGQPIASDTWLDCNVPHCTSQPGSANGWHLIVVESTGLSFGTVCEKSGSFQAGHPLNLMVNCGGHVAFKLSKGKGC